MRPTAPRPIFRMQHQFSFHGIRVHVFQLLSQLLRAPHVEVVKPPLPERHLTRHHPGKRQRQLSRHRLLSSSAQRPGNLLLQHLQYLRRRTFPRLAHQQVHVFRHHHITDHLETVPGTYFIEYSDEAIPCACRSKKWATTIATDGDEVQIAAAVVAS